MHRLMYGPDLLLNGAFGLNCDTGHTKLFIYNHCTIKTSFVSALGP